MAKPAMINCPSCDHSVSTSAMSCPNCGAVLRKAKRGFFGKLVIWGFWIFNILMVMWFIGGVNLVAEEGAGLTGAEAAGHAIGSGIGMTMIVTIWLIGAVIIGIMALLTRPRG